MFKAKLCLMATYIKAMVTVMVYVGTYQACFVTSPSAVAIAACAADADGTIQNEIPYDQARIHTTTHVFLYFAKSY